MEIILEGERPISWNQLYSGGMHWSQRKAEADRVHGMVKVSCLTQNIHQLFTNPVDIIITAYFKNRPLDVDNICSKLYIDGLKGLVIPDDAPQSVRSLTTRSLIDKQCPRLVIQVVEDQPSNPLPQ